MRILGQEGFNIFFLIGFFLSIQTLFCNGIDVINTTHTFRDGDTLISSGGSFEFGFFRPGNSRYKYLGIWYREITVLTVLWVANRDSPVTNESGTVLKVLHPGILVLQNSTNSIVWSSNTSSSSSRLVAKLPVAQLLDDGNLVVKEANDDNPDNYLWQSFENPTDTLLGGMKFGHLPTGHENFLSSWKSSDDPGTGAYTFYLDPTGYPQNVLKQDSVELYRSGPWNGLGYSGMTGLRNNTIYSFELVMEGDTVYYLYESLDKSIITRFVLNHSGIAQRWAWNNRTHGWELYLEAPASACDNYNQCRMYGNCALLNSPICKCLDKFIPKDQEAWAVMDWSNGCVRRTALAVDCKTDGFVKYPNVKLPDARTSWFNRSMTLAECREVCLRNCSCMGYASLDVRNGGSGCLLWSGDLIDTRQLYHETDQDLFVRVASSESDIVESKKKNGAILIASLASTGGIMILVGSLLICCICKRKKFYRKLRERGWHKENNELELPLIELHRISKATDAFSLGNKLGEGGFGPVYEGMLEDGQEIAVKRLSKTSFQGIDEFKNEVICIARLQHRNLVKLLGCCIQGDEKMLIYEYMPNKSVDLILFDDEKSKLIDWPKRFHIITGIARGLLYLHQDSRLRIIHRDLKVSNILLDVDMNPKISDFGLARIFGGNETEANTSKVVGTYGYMSPEYASKGLFSIKSDVYSFGVIVLEILSGQRNRGFSCKNHDHNLLGHAWLLHKDGKSLELVEDTIMESCSMSEVLRSIHVGLLCVQAHPEDRPSMSNVVNMLENDVLLPSPRQPGFFIQEDSDFITSTEASSKNEISITMLDPR